MFFSKQIKLIGFLFIVTILTWAYLHPAHADTKKIAITAIVEHAALDAVRDGVISRLDELGYHKGENLEVTFETAQNSQATAVQIAKRFVGKQPDVIVSISTPSSQAMAAATKDIPIVFSAVTDPVAAGLVKSWSDIDANITGVSDYFPPSKHLELIREILPGIRSLGVISNQGETNSVAIVGELKEAIIDMDIELVESSVTKTSEVRQAAARLVGKVDAIYVPADNTVIAALETVIAIGQNQNIPVFAGDTDSVKRGAVASISFNYYEVGRQTGEVVAKLFKGEDIKNIPVETVKNTELFVNLASAKKMGVKIPTAIVDSAKEVIE